MAACFDLIAGSLIQSVNQTLPCAQFTVMTGQEFSNLSVMSDVFSVPAVTDLQQMFMTGISLPLICWLTAWAFNAIISEFNKD